ncbi:MAG: hypothetical protein ABL857_04735 [Rickettsiales bacterium]
MEQLVGFLSSDSGKVVCYALLIVGCIDVFVIPMILKKIIGKNEAKLPEALTAEKLKNAEAKAKNMQIIVRITRNMGMAFIVFAIFGLTR